MMNERIKELLEQTDIPQFPILGSLAWVATDHDMKKFAELIIQECIEIVLESDPSPKMSLQEPYATIMFNIKNHFGVE